MYSGKNMTEVTSYVWTLIKDTPSPQAWTAMTLSFDLVIARPCPGRPEVATDLPLIQYLFHTPQFKSVNTVYTS